MKLRATLPLLAAFLLATPVFHAQNPPAQTTTHSTPRPQMKQASGAAPDKVWVNTASNVYHCPDDRYYGKTKAGKYMTEPEAKAAGAHGVKGQTCFK